MLNDIVSGIMLKLDDTFNGECEIYIEEMPQGFTGPCFSVLCTNMTTSQVLGTRYWRTNSFSIQYFPKSTTEAREECLNVLEQLFEALEYITVTGDLVRGTNMDGQIVDGVLVFAINYDFYVRANTERDPMETLRIINESE